MSEASDSDIDALITQGTAPAGNVTAPTVTVGVPTPPAANPAAPTSQTGLAINNPLNLRPLQQGAWSGQNGTSNGFASFDNIADGWAAADQNMVAKVKQHGLRTLANIIGDPQDGWAPASDNNNPAQYAATVGTALGVKPTDDIGDRILNDPDFRHSLLGTMASKVEIGKPLSYGASGPTTVQPGALSDDDIDAIVTGQINAQTDPQLGLPGATDAQRAALAEQQWRAASGGKNVQWPIFDPLSKVGRNQDGSIAYIGQPSTTSQGPGGPQIDINATSNPDEIAAWLKAHPLDPANHQQGGAQPGDTDGIDQPDAFDLASKGAASGVSVAGHSLEGIDARLRSVPVGNLLLNAAGDFQDPNLERADYGQFLLNNGREEQAFGNNAFYNGGKLVGEVGATLPLAALTDGTSLAGTGGNLFTRAAGYAGAGAIQGAEAGALTSADSSKPLAQQVAEGAGAGAALGVGVPAAFQALKAPFDAAGGLYRFGRNAVMPLTAPGRDQIADQVINRFATGGPTALDATPYVSGSAPTLAQATANPGLAAAERAVRDVLPNRFGSLDQANAAARINHLTSIAGTPETVEELQAARDHAALPMLDSALKGAGPADASGVVSTIDGLLKSPAGQRDAVVSSLGKIRAKLVNPDGTFQTDPSQLYGVRQAIGDELSPLAARNGSNAQLATHELMTVRGALDDSIEQAAPGFKGYLQTYAKMSGPANAQEYLQGLNLTDAQGHVTLPKVQNALTAIQRKQGLPGVNGAKSVSPEQIGALEGLRDDLLRAQNSSLGKSIGSNTFQNLASNNLFAQAGAPLTAAGALASHHPWIAPLVWGGKMLYKSQNADILDRVADRLINPDIGATAFAPTPAAPNKFGVSMGPVAGAINDNAPTFGVLGLKQQQSGQ